MPRKTPDDRPLKSAYELALERLSADDRDRGVAAERPLSPAQKARIAELRSEARAKLAEIEILHRKHLAEAGSDPAKLQQTEERYRIDRRRVESALEDAVLRVRREKKR